MAGDLSAWINPLQFPEVDEPWASTGKLPIDVEAIIRFATTPGAAGSLESLVARYRDISTEPVRLFAAPAEPRILEKLVWPLRNAKVAYMFGNCLGTIAMCGMVAEMVAILLFDIAEISINNQPITKADQISLFGSSFEKLSQQRRVAILRAYSIIDDDLERAFTLIRERRRRYLHLWSQDHESLPGDAVATFQAAVRIVVKAIGQDINQGKIVLNPALAKYLERLGRFEDPGVPE
jgi:hypothetical protein